MWSGGTGAHLSDLEQSLLRRAVDLARGSGSKRRAPRLQLLSDHDLHDKVRTIYARWSRHYRERPNTIIRFGTQERIAAEVDQLKLTRVAEVDAFVHDGTFALGMYAPVNDFVDYTDLIARTRILRRRSFPEWLELTNLIGHIYVNEYEPNALHAFAVSLSGFATHHTFDVPRQREVRQQVIRLYREVMASNPQADGTLHNWGVQLARLARLCDDVTERREIHERAIAKYREAFELNQARTDSLHNVNSELLEIALLPGLSAQERELRYDSAIRVCQQVLALDPNASSSLHDWAYALGEKKELPHISTARAAQLSREAYEVYERALLVDPHPETLKSAGCELHDLAGLTEEPSEKRLIRLRALAKFEDAAVAIRARPTAADEASVHRWIGLENSLLAELSDDEEERARRHAAVAAFQVAIDVGGDDVTILSSLSSELCALATVLSPEEAREKLLLVMDIERRHAAALGLPEEAMYNRACMLARLGRNEEALTSLSVVLEHAQIDAEFVAQDDDWDPLRNDPRFITLINEYT